MLDGMADPVWELMDSERLALTEFAAGLTADEFEVQSLCAAWRVRDVLAHVAWGSTHPPLKTVVAVVRGGFRANAVNAKLSRQWGDLPTDQIVAHLRGAVGARTRTPGTRPVDVLADLLVHDLDLRVPLGRPRPPPVPAYRLALQRYVAMGWPLSMAFGRNPKATARGFRLVAEDIGWSHGEGPDVTGRSTALLLALTGRPVDGGEFAGEGASAFAERLTDGAVP